MTDKKDVTVTNTAHGGITVMSNIDVTVPSRKNIFGRVCLVIAAFLGLFGTVFSFFTQFDTPLSYYTVGFYCTVFFTLFTVILMLPSRLHIAVIPLSIISFALMYFKWQKFSLGFKLMFNHVYTVAFNGSKFFSVKADIESEELFAAFIIFYLSLLICYSVLTQPSAFLSFLVTFPFVEIGLYLGKSPSAVPGAMVMLFWTVMVTLGLSGYYQKFPKGSSGFMRSGNCFIAKPGIKFYTAGLSVSIVAVIFCLIFLLTFIVKTLTGYERPERIDTMRSDLKTAAEEFSFDSISESLQRFTASLGFGKTKMFTNKLGSVSSLHFKHSTDITVTAESRPDNCDVIYLKGFTGGVYSSDEWKAMKKSFDGRDTMPQDMLSRYFSERYDFKTIDMSIHSEYSNEKYNYIPYIRRLYGEKEYVADGDVTLEDRQDYSFGCGNIGITADKLPDILSGLDYSINEDMDFYTDYVMDNYLALPDSEGLDNVYEKYVKDSELSEDEDVLKKLSCIKQILGERARYTLSPGRTPDSRDFVDYFLNDNHQGYCVHFATAAIVLARMSGIPARYASGYVLQKADFSDENKISGDRYEIKVEDSRAHAWAEIYFDKLGWVPFEFTPSEAAALEGIQENEEETTSPAVTEAVTTAAQTVTKEQTAIRSTQKQTSMTSSNTGIKPSATKDEPMSMKVKLLLGFMLAAAAVTAVLAARYLFIQNRRKKVFSGNSNKEKAVLSYDTAVRLLEFDGYPRENLQYLEYAQGIDRRYGNIGARELTQIVLKAQLSGISISDSEALKAQELMENISAVIYEKYKPLKQAYMRFIKLL